MMPSLISDYEIPPMVSFSPGPSFTDPQTYELGRDKSSGLFYLNLFVGSRSERVEMLIDTMVTGNAIEYNIDISTTAIPSFRNADTVQSNQA